MSFIELDGVETAQELKTVPEGEHKLRILEAKIGASQKTGGNFLQLRLEITDDPRAKDVTHVIMFPTSSDDTKTAENRKLAVQKLQKAFNMPVSSKIETEDFVGQEGWGILTEEETAEYGKQNRIRRFVTGA